jgi:hypothetical protein
LAEVLFAVMTTVSPLIVALSNAKPAGLSDEEWRLRAMRLILFSNQTNTSSTKSSNLSQPTVPAAFRLRKEKATVSVVCGCEAG